MKLQTNLLSPRKAPNKDFGSEPRRLRTDPDYCLTVLNVQKKRNLVHSLWDGPPERGFWDPPLLPEATCWIYSSPLDFMGSPSRPVAPTEIGSQQPTAIRSWQREEEEEEEGRGRLGGGRGRPQVPARSQWARLSLNRGPPEPSVGTGALRGQWAPVDLNRQIECQIECQIESQTECQIECQIGC